MIAGIQSTHRAQLLCFCCFHLVCLLCRCVTFFRVFLECNFSFMAASVGRFLFSFVTGFNLEKVWRISVSARMQTKPVTEKCRHGMDIFSFLHLCIHIYACIYIYDVVLCFLLEAPTDECRLSRNICGHGECENSLTGHICHCHPGYHFNPQRNICEGKRQW